MISWLLQDGVPTRSAPVRDALRDACSTCSMERGWLVSGALAVGGWWFTSTLSPSAVHGRVASHPLRAGVPLAGLQFFRVAGWGWVAEMSGCIAGSARPIEKSGQGCLDASIHRLSSW